MTVKTDNITKYRRTAIQKVLDTDEGITVFRYLMQICGYHLPTLSFDPQTRNLNTEVMIFNEARRSIWLDLRKDIPAERLAAIELKEEKSNDD